MNKNTTIAALLIAQFTFAAIAADVTALCADRAAIERVYYAHRTGTKPPFEQVMPPELLDKLTRADLRKEAVLRKVYGVDVTPSLFEAEVRRINTTTRAPEMLAEIKAALGGDPARFAASFAKPILVERLLREKFDNDDALHATQRHEVEQVREELLAAKKNGAEVAKLLPLLKARHPNEVRETTGQLGARPEAKPGIPTSDETEIKKRFGPDAKLLSRPGDGGREQTFYFDDLPAELQKVLRVQLRQPGDVSAVIETPGGFLLYLATEKAVEKLGVAILSIPKRSYEDWLAQQPGERPGETVK
jgi:hypothetical protein